MALPDSAKIVIGTPVVLADTTDYSPTAANNLGTRTNQIDLTSLAAGAARQSDKIEFGDASGNLDVEYVLAAVIEWAAGGPTAGETVDFYLAPSSSGTAGTNNPGGVSGSDSAYAGYSSNLDASLKQLMFLGSMVATVQATTTVQIDMSIATFTPPQRYGTIVVKNAAGTRAFVADAVEMAIALFPKTLQVQD